eukprot:Clim_evm9s170 gene=Clim_evmTU9s170
MRVFEIFSFITCGVAMTMAADQAVSTGDFKWPVPQYPEQIHISPFNVEGDNNEYVVRWATALPALVVEGCDPEKTYKATANIWHYDDVSHSDGVSFEGRSWLFHDPGSEPDQFIQLFHEVKINIRRLTEQTDRGSSRYFRYMVGDPQYGYSAIMMLETLPKKLLPHEPLKMIIFGDMGWENSVSMPLIEERIRNEQFHAVFHGGDFAYDMDTNNSTNGDHFMRSIESFASRLPYLVTMGNHESNWLFYNYLERFTQPNKASNSTSPFYWSMNLPHVHIVSVSSELYFYNTSANPSYGAEIPIEDMVRQQWEWLKADLEAVDRTVYPHIIIWEGCDPEKTYKATANIWHYDDVSHRDGVSFEGRSWLFHDPGSEPDQFIQLFHEVKINIRRLTEQTDRGSSRYFRYMVGDPQYGYSAIMMLETLPKKLLPHEPLKMIIFGDMGWENSVSMPLIEERIRNEQFHAVFHGGDFAYDMDTNNSTNGDHFMRSIESFASRLPYLVTMGNHESNWLFYNYLERFTQPNKASNSTSPFYWSMNLPHVHIVSVSSELYFYNTSANPPYGAEIPIEDMVRQQWEWLKDDLEAVDRTVYPHIIIWGHRPMYCSADEYHCGEATVTLREGILVNTTDGQERMWGLEDLLVENDVRLYIAGHVHNGERTWPVKDGEPEKTEGVSLHVYQNPQAPTHLTIGNAGNREVLMPFSSWHDWDAKHYEGYGYGVMEVTESKIEIRLYASPSNEMYDWVTLIRTCSDDNPWTIQPTGGACWYNKTNDECALCMHGGCQCGPDKPHVCVKCGDDDGCEDAAPCENFFF